ncbi:MAG: HAMP domain-containing histidine kinase [Campylobacterales bacterium]|nr:HAMP domain-containing histidine kinase [Campylobacterales bacterium]
MITNAKDAILAREAIGKSVDGLIELKAMKKDEEIEIYIIDNGIGIEQSILDKVFDPYFTTKFEAQGIGLGLYMSKMIIEKNMGGKLSCQNGKNGGAEFKIILNESKGGLNELS